MLTKNCHGYQNYATNNYLDCNKSNLDIDEPDSSDSSEELYNYETNRIITFAAWTNKFIDPKTLALLGFYYNRPPDIVKCNFCKTEIGNWEFGDDVLIEHLRWSPNCSLLRGNSKTNVPINKELLEMKIYQVPHNVIIGESQLNILNPGNITQALNSHPFYEKLENRLKSFENWPKTSKQNPEELAEAGFFYLNQEDKVKCFACGGGLKDWEDGDVPWEQHILFYENCIYIYKVKGIKFIEEIKLKFQH